MFGAFERLVALRYLRARRQEGFISVIAFFSLAGITLGVATLIIVMAVMNGFRHELLSRILGVNGHVNVLVSTKRLDDFDTMVLKIKEVPEVVNAAPIVEGQVMGHWCGACVRKIFCAVPCLLIALSPEVWMGLRMARA